MGRPEYLTLEQGTDAQHAAVDRIETERENVEALARRMANAAPARQGTNVFRAGVPWTLVHEMRAALAELDRARTDAGMGT